MADGDLTYEEAGVSVAAGAEAVRLLKQRLKSTRHPLVLEGIGGFGGVMQMPPLKDPVLVAGTDGVGTKVLIAQALDRYDTIGIDLVAMSVNDVSACGAVPLFFLDYIVTGKVRPEMVADLVGGVDEGCLQAQCALLGGETAEHPGHFASDDDFDMAGFAVGVADRGELWGPGKVVDGDVLIGISSNGLHSNGFSLVRALLAKHTIPLSDPFPGADDQSIGEVLLTPTLIYSPVLHDLSHTRTVHAAAHNTGGGFPENVGRAVPDGLAAEIDLSTWIPAPVFSWINGLGVSADEMLNTFNCGLGMIVVLPRSDVAAALRVIAKAGIDARAIGEVTARGDGPAVRYRGELCL